MQTFNPAIYSTFQAWLEKKNSSLLELMFLRNETFSEKNDLCTFPSSWK